MRAERVAAQRGAVLVYWDGRSRREQALLAGLAAILAAVVLAVWVVGPLQRGRADAVNQIRAHDTLQPGLRAAALSPSRGNARRSGDPAAVVAAVAAEFGLLVAESAPDGRGVRVRLAEARFDDVLRWLAEIERSSDLRLADIAVSRGSAPGLVAVQLVLGR